MVTLCVVYWFMSEMTVFRIKFVRISFLLWIIALLNHSEQNASKVKSMTGNTKSWLTLYCLLRTKVHEFWKISILKLEGIIKKNSYERCDYESVDEKSLS